MNICLHRKHKDVEQLQNSQKERHNFEQIKKGTCFFLLSLVLRASKRERSASLLHFEKLADSKIKRANI